MSDKETALERITPRALAKQRVLDLDLSVDEAVTRFRDQIGMPVLAKEHAALPPSGKAFAEVEGDRFKIYHPLKSTHRHSDVGIGPGVEGQLVSTPHGCRLELRSRTLAPTRSQSLRAMGAFGLVGLAVLGMFSADAFGLTLLMLLGAVVVMGIRWRKLRQRELDLIAQVQRVFGPVTRAAIHEPYRGDRRALPEGSSDPVD